MTLSKFSKIFPNSRYVPCQDKIRQGKSTYTADEIEQQDCQIGWVVEAGYIVLDFDEELEGVKKFLKANGLWKTTTTFSTPSGGLHLIFKDSDSSRIQKIKSHLACGLRADLRVAGKGYIITPFNSEDGREVISMVEPIELPKLLTPLNIKSNSEQFITYPIQEGGRNDTLFRQASRLRAENFEQDDIIEILTSINKAFIMPPIDDKEIAIIADSVCKYDKGKGSAFGIANDRGSIVAVDTVGMVDWIIKTHSMYAVNGELYVYKDGVYAENGVYIRDVIKKALPLKYVSYGKIMEIYKLLCDDIRLQVDYDFLNRDKTIVNMKNGIYDLENSCLKQHMPNYINTVQINAEWVDTTGEKLKDTLFGEFLIDICGIGKDDIKMLLEFMTYSMTLFNNKKCMMFMVGPSSTGKSVLIKIIESMVGYHNVSNIGLHELNQRFYPASLKDKLLNSNADNSSVPLSGIENIKKITGQDAIMHEKKGQNPFFFFPFAKLIFSFNQLPLQLEEKSDAFYKRLRVLHMPKKITLEQEYVDRLVSREEINKIASMLLKAYGKKMIDTNTIYSSKHSDFLVQQLRAGSDTVEAFILEGCVVGSFTERKELYDAYVMYCLQTERKHAGMHSFYKTMGDKGYEPKRKRVDGKLLTVYENIEVGSREV